MTEPGTRVWRVTRVWDVAAVTSDQALQLATTGTHRHAHVQRLGSWDEIDDGGVHHLGTSEPVTRRGVASFVGSVIELREWLESELGGRGRRVG